jgi:hypothetical protein
MMRVLTGRRITNLAAAPTVYRLMMASGDAVMAPIAGQLRVASSAGEPLNPEVARWAERVLRVPLKDHYGQRRNQRQRERGCTRDAGRTPCAAYPRSNAFPAVTIGSTVQ